MSNRKLPVIIGECDPEGCAACREPRNAYRNGTMYSSYTAAVFPRILELAGKHNINLDGALTWAFQFEGQPPFAGLKNYTELLEAKRSLPHRLHERLPKDVTCFSAAER